MLKTLNPFVYFTFTSDCFSIHLVAASESLNEVAMAIRRLVLFYYLILKLANILLLGFLSLLEGLQTYLNLFSNDRHF